MPSKWVHVAGEGVQKLKYPFIALWHLLCDACINQRRSTDEETSRESNAAIDTDRADACRATG
jgi:hypothetical protein